MDPTLQQGKRLLQWGVAIYTLIAAAPLGYLFVTNNTSLNGIVPSFLILIGGMPWLTFYGSNRTRLASGFGALMVAMIALPIAVALFVYKGPLEGTLVTVLVTLLCFLSHVFLYSKKVQVYVVSVHLAKRLQGGRATPDEVLQTPRIQALLSEPKTGFTNAHLAGGLLMAGVLWVFLLMFIPSILLLIGYHTWPRQKAPFAEAHQRAINSFVASEGFGIGRFGKRPEFWQEWSVVFEETLYRSEGIRLIGLTPENGERYFSYYYMPKKESLAKANHRPLTSDESEAVAQLREGKPWAKFLVKPTPENEYDSSLRVIAPVFAQQSCLECHEVKEGTLLGAFDYWLYDMEQQDPPGPIHP